MARIKQDPVLGRLETVLSNERLGRYYTPATEPIARAYPRYAYNVALCEAFYPALHMLEVVLRNHLVALVNLELPKRYPGVVLGSRTSAAVGALSPSMVDIVSWLDPAWLQRTWPGGAQPFLDPQYVPKENQKARNKLFREVRQNGIKTLVPRNGRPVTEGQLVAAMEFGFWTGLFNGYYSMRSKADRRLWPDLLPAAFPHRTPAFTALAGPGNPKDLLHDIRQFRNRIFHHERIFDDPGLHAKHALIGDLIGWISPDAQQLLAKYDRVPDLLREKDRGARIWFHRCTWR